MSFKSENILAVKSNSESSNIQNLKLIMPRDQLQQPDQQFQ